MGWMVNVTLRSLYPRECETRYQLCSRMGRPHGRSGRVRKLSPPPGFGPHSIQPIASRYTDWAIPAHDKLMILILSLRIVICNNRVIIWVVNWKGCERTRPFSDYKSCHRTCPTLFRKHGLLVDQDIDRRYAIRIRDLPIRVGSAATTPGCSVFCVVKWIVIDWNPQLSKGCGKCVDTSWENFLTGLIW